LKLRNFLDVLVGHLGWWIGQSQGLYLHNTEQKNLDTTMLRAGLEPTIPMFERSKTKRALDRAATGAGK